MKKSIKTVSPKKFLTKSGEYVFPFKLIDDTPGGASLGRIQWMVELHPATKSRKENQKRLKEVWIWATQTRDKRYKGKIFKFKSYAECITTDVNSRRETAYAPWRMFFCDVHKGAFVLDAYPTDGCKELVVSNWSSISFEVKFR